LPYNSVTAVSMAAAHRKVGGDCTNERVKPQYRAAGGLRHHGDSLSHSAFGVTGVHGSLPGDSSFHAVPQTGENSPSPHTDFH
jgi:hypothetical protein